MIITGKLSSYTSTVEEVLAGAGMIAVVALPVICI